MSEVGEGLKSASKLTPDETPDSVMVCGQLDPRALERLFARFGGDRLTVERVADETSIPGSFWGDPEAGIQGTTLFVRADTPVHSALHEGCHLLCADRRRREEVDTNIGGDYDEENAVCYLQILLADHLDGVGRERLFADMDAWGYSFRLGSTRRWFEEDAEDARDWLIREGLLSPARQPTWRARGD